MGEELPRAAVARLDFVEDELHAVAAGRLAQPAQEVVRGDADARNALDALDDDGGEAPRREQLLDPLQVAQWGKLDVVRRVEGGAERRIVRRGDGPRRAAVKGTREGEDVRAARMERGQLHGVLVGLGPRVAEEERVVVVARCAAQTLGQLALERIFDRIGVEAQSCDLLRDAVDVGLVGVAERDDRMAAVEVEVLGAGGVVDEVAAAPDGLRGVERIYVEWFHVRVVFG